MINATPHMRQILEKNCHFPYPEYQPNLGLCRWTKNHGWASYAASAFHLFNHNPWSVTSIAS